MMRSEDAARKLYLDAVVERRGEEHHAVREDGVVLTVRGGKAFLRTAIKLHRDGRIERRRALVGELDGVRCYVLGDSIVLTREDLQL